MFDIFNKKYHEKNFFKVISDNANWSFGRKCTDDGHWSFVWIHDKDVPLSATKEKCND